MFCIFWLNNFDIMLFTFHWMSNTRISIACFGITLSLISISHDNKAVKCFQADFNQINTISILSCKMLINQRSPLYFYSLTFSFKIQQHIPVPLLYSRCNFQDLFKSMTLRLPHLDQVIIVWSHLKLFHNYFSLCCLFSKVPLNYLIPGIR